MTSSFAGNFQLFTLAAQRRASLSVTPVQPQTSRVASLKQASCFEDLRSGQKYGGIGHGVCIYGAVRAFCFTICGLGLGVGRSIPKPRPAPARKSTQALEDGRRRPNPTSKEKSYGRCSSRNETNPGLDWVDDERDGADRTRRISLADVCRSGRRWQ